jgi:hypothetical protein
LVAGHVAAPGDSTNGDSAATNWPPRHLDQDPIGSPPGSSRIPPTRLGFFPFPVLPPQEGGRGESGGMWGKKEEALSVASPLTRRDRSNRGPSAPGGRSREPLRDVDAKRKEQSRDDAAVYYFTAPPVFPEPATPTPPPQREHFAAVLLFLPPWSLSCDAGAHPSDVPAASRRTTLFHLACVLAFAPQNCRPVTA